MIDSTCIRSHATCNSRFASAWKAAKNNKHAIPFVLDANQSICTLNQLQTTRLPAPPPVASEPIPKARDFSVSPQLDLVIHITKNSTISNAATIHADDSGAILNAVKILTITLAYMISKSR